MASVTATYSWGRYRFIEVKTIIPGDSYPDAIAEARASTRRAVAEILTDVVAIEDAEEQAAILAELEADQGDGEQ